MDRDEQAAVLHGEAKRVAEGLGAGWKYVEPDPDGEWRWVAEVEHDSGRRLVLQLDKGRVEVRPRYRYGERHFNPWDTGQVPYGKPGPQATYQQGRPIEPVVRQIQSKVIAPYVVIWDAALARMQAKDDREAETKALADRLAALVDRKADYWKPEEKSMIGFEHGHMEVRGDEVRIELSKLSEAQAVAVIKALWA